ncbi:hypothetical protein [Sinorhizobium sp. BJ1]|uniref:hypothetical protein n=1 Tax=Sinorhizobium sp. BJ1 TaxID=2035455 RepID=UPI000BE873C2|nr:hypothetical protein [Sinorhizobium sp. BJ1]PDT79878.1 hypothetical protein CO676_30800 [Sinorhizobium sp. BJ1]
MFGIKSIAKINIGSIGRTIPAQDISKINLAFATSLSKNLPNNFSGALTKLLGTALLPKLSSLDPSDKAIAANPVLRDAILALQKQAGAGNAKAVAKAYSQF